MPRKKKTRKSQDLQPDEFADLREKRDRDRATREAEEKERSQLAKMMQRTQDAVALAARGTKDRPTHDPFDENPREVLISSQEWAPLIADAAAAWSVWPGAKVLDEKPIPDAGAGVEAAERIWKRTIDGAPVKTVLKLLKAARGALGKWDGKGDHRDSELGILTFFKQLNQYLGNEWRPPHGKRNPRPVSPMAASGTTTTEGTSGTSDSRSTKDLRSSDFGAKEFAMVKQVPLLFEADAVWIVDSRSIWHRDRLRKPQLSGGSIVVALQLLRSHLVKAPGTRLLNGQIAKHARYSSGIAASRALKDLIKRERTGRFWGAILDPPPTTSPRNTGWRMVDPRATPDT
jgi:hypothetical protein